MLNVAISSPLMRRTMAKWKAQLPTGVAIFFYSNLITECGVLHPVLVDRVYCEVCEIVGRVTAG